MVQENVEALCADRVVVLVQLIHALFRRVLFLRCFCLVEVNVLFDAVLESDDIGDLQCVVAETVWDELDGFGFELVDGVSEFFALGEAEERCVVVLFGELEQRELCFFEGRHFDAVVGDVEIVQNGTELGRARVVEVLEELNVVRGPIGGGRGGRRGRCGAALTIRIGQGLHTLRSWRGEGARVEGKE